MNQTSSSPTRSEASLELLDGNIRGSRSPTAYASRAEVANDLRSLVPHESRRSEILAMSSTHAGYLQESFHCSNSSAGSTADCKAAASHTYKASKGPSPWNADDSVYPKQITAESGNPADQANDAEDERPMEELISAAQETNMGEASSLTFKNLGSSSVHTNDPETSTQVNKSSDSPVRDRNSLGRPAQHDAFSKTCTQGNTDPKAPVEDEELSAKFAHDTRPSGTSAQDDESVCVSDEIPIETSMGAEASLETPSVYETL